jgi:hypothetical protein
MADVWLAKDCTLKIVDADNIYIDSSTVLSTEFTNATGGATSFHAYAKDVTITEPEGSVDKIDLVGVDGNSFQNAVLDHKPYGLARITCTMVLDGDESLETFVYGSGTAIEAGATDYVRYQAKSANRQPCAILVNLNDGTDEISFVLDEAIIIDLGDRKLSGADGHWEMELEAVCLPKDFYIEYKN